MPVRWIASIPKRTATNSQPRRCCISTRLNASIAAHVCRSVRSLRSSHWMTCRRSGKSTPSVTRNTSVASFQEDFSTRGAELASLFAFRQGDRPALQEVLNFFDEHVGRVALGDKGVGYFQSFAGQGKISGQENDRYPGTPAAHLGGDFSPIQFGHEVV